MDGQSSDLKLYRVRWEYEIFTGQYIERSLYEIPRKLPLWDLWLFEDVIIVPCVMCDEIRMSPLSFHEICDPKVA